MGKTNQKERRGARWLRNEGSISRKFASVKVLGT
jgi:hypothetical protein